MAVTQVKICNLALGRVGADRISSITESNKRAILLNAIYEQCRDEVQRDGLWNFNQKRTTLNPTSTAPDWGYVYEYDLPSDYLGRLQLEEDDIDHVLEDSKIRTNEPSLNVTYNYRNEDENSWDASFGSAFAWKLAAEISFALTGSLALAQACQAQYQKSLDEARFNDSSEGNAPEVELVDWTDSRR